MPIRGSRVLVLLWQVAEQYFWFGVPPTNKFPHVLPASSRGVGFRRVLTAVGRVLKRVTAMRAIREVVPLDDWNADGSVLLPP